jgi:hypothetical protein
MLTRREFLATAACTVAAARLHAQGQSKVRVALPIPSDATGPHMPVDFVGLSYGVQQLADLNNLNENRFAQTGQVLRHCSHATGLRLTLT